MSDHSGEHDPLDRGPAGPPELPEVEGYDAIDFIGRGGMGEVYEALQRSTGRRVALKIMLERAAATEPARRRFEREIELIARLQHPGIVGIIDSGTHEGRHYFVMEYIEGRPLDGALPPGACDIRQAVRTLTLIARAVDYAHQRGVMHRDLKPGNILVDEKGMPRLLDFGLAKAFDPNSMAIRRDSVSEPGQIIGTLGYMAPEQARGDVSRLSVRSDVYALGAIAYELITGDLPCSVSGPISLVFQRIESRDPAPPSRLRPGVPPDIDAVLLRALEKDPARRYPTAAAFAEDLERWLEDRPVSARRAGPGERALRWCRRNPALAGVFALAVLIALVIAASLWITSASERARTAAELRRAKSQDRIRLAMISISPDEARGMPIPVVAADRIAASLVASPEPPIDEADIRAELGEIYRTYGLLDKAEENTLRALELRSGALRAPHADIARSLRNAGAVAYDRGEFTEAEGYYRRALDMRRTLHASADHEDIADSMNHLAQTLARLRRFDEAESLQNRVIDMRRRLYSEESDKVAASINNLATILAQKGDYRRAEALYSEALDRLRRILGTEMHRFVARGLRNVAGCRLGTGSTEGVADLLGEAHRIASAVLSADHPEAASALFDLSLVLLHEGDTAAAEREAREAFRAVGERSDADGAKARTALARVLVAAGSPDKAAALLHEAISLLRDASPVPVREAAEAEAVLGAALAASGRARDAVPLLEAALEVLTRERGADHLITRRCAGDLDAARRLAAREGAE